MNIIVDRPQLVRVALLYLNNNFGNLTRKTYLNIPDKVFYVDSDNEALMRYDKKTKDVWILYGKMWSKIQSLFSLEYNDIQSIMKVWLEETYKLKGITPVWRLHRMQMPLEETYKLKGITPGLPKP